ncbi:MAG: tetratricopeptide repeat protein [Patescibacteria group bacterium]|nr:tetratricopeptide repeat protein [Patescibacteria group bacterium]
MFELLIFVATIVLLFVVLGKLPLEEEVVTKLVAEAKQHDDEEGGPKKENALTRADKYAGSGDYVKAEKIYLRLITKDPQDASLYNKLALVYLSKKAFADAKHALDQALQLEPDNDTFYNNQGLTAYSQGEYDEAVEAYEKSIEINNKVASRFMNLGLAYQMLKQNRKATDAYEKALILEPQNEEYKRLLLESEAKLK